MESSNASLLAYLKFLILLWEISVRIFYNLWVAGGSLTFAFSPHPFPHGFLV